MLRVIIDREVYCFKNSAYTHVIYTSTSTLACTPIHNIYEGNTNYEKL